VSVLVVAQPSSEVLEGLMNYPAHIYILTCSHTHIQVFLKSG
jgi:hypothetical protein